MLLLDLHHDFDMVADEVQLVDRAHLHTCNSYGRAFFETSDVGEHCLDRVALPEEAAGSAEQEDQGARHHEGEDRHEADLQLRPGE
jgi:hypothetical protein